MSIKKVAMIIIMENDLESAVVFYKKLGLTLSFHVPDKWAEFKLSNLAIGLCPTTEKIAYNRTGIVLEIMNLEQFYQDQKEQLNFLDKPTQASHGVMTSIQDPSGNIIDLYQPTFQKLKEGQGCGQACSCSAQEEQKADSCCKNEPVSTGCC